MHTSPLAQPGTGDSGGMNVYVRELAGSLARAGVPVTVFVRRWAEGLPDRVQVEPGMSVVHVDAGPIDAAKEDLPAYVDEYADAVEAHITSEDSTEAEAGEPFDVLHANYWLSAVAGHRLKHRLSLPLVATFHTLARVKAEAGDTEPLSRALAEAETVGCCDAICASNPVEAEDLIHHYGADPDRIELVSPGVDHAFFSPGDRAGARAALGLGEHPTMLFVGRIQPLKGLTVAVEALSMVGNPETRLVVVGGPSGTEGDTEFERVKGRIADLGLTERVTFVDPQPHHALSTWYRSADVVVVPSRSESFGLVALEAAACGIPVVAAAVGGLRTLVDEGRTGHLVGSTDAATMAARIDGLFADPQGAERMGVSAAQAANDYSWPVTAGRLRRLYADLSTNAPVQCR